MHASDCSRWSRGPCTCRPPETIAPADRDAIAAEHRALADAVVRAWSGGAEEARIRDAIDVTTGQNVRGGASPEEARRLAVVAARRHFGADVPYHRS